MHQILATLDMDVQVLCLLLSEKIIGLATKNLTKILRNLLKRPIQRISAACDEFRGEPQIPQRGMKFYMQ